MVVAIPLSDTNQTLEQLLLVEGIVIVGVLALIGAFALVVVRVGLLPLDRMGHTAAAIAGGDLSHRVETVDPRTEVGRLGLALNRMLDRLEDAFADREASAGAAAPVHRRRVARAAHAAGHRSAATPSSTAWASPREQADVEKAMRRIEDEAARMGVLVEDLLTLARLDEVRAAPHGPVDLALLAGDAVDDARATAPDRSISLDGAPARVTGDADQLRQVLANLLRNALVHTPAGTPIDVTVGRPTAPCALEVRDHGPGPAGRRTRARCSSASGAPRAAARRARRARASGSRSSPGSSTPTAGPSPPRTRPTAARRSRSGFPRAEPKGRSYAQSAPRSTVLIRVLAWLG